MSDLRPEFIDNLQTNSSQIIARFEEEMPTLEDSWITFCDLWPWGETNCSQPQPSMAKWRSPKDEQKFFGIKTLTRSRERCIFDHLQG